MRATMIFAPSIKPNRDRDKSRHSALLLAVCWLCWQQLTVKAQQQQQLHLLNSQSGSNLGAGPLAPLLTPTPLYQQHNNILHFWVSEGAPVGTPIGNIRSADNQLPWYILPAQGTDTSEELLNSAFAFNLSTGDITTSAPLDRETREYYNFVAIAGNPFAEVKCTITVKDINDNAPMFQVSAANGSAVLLEVPEGQRGVRKPLPLAVDLDTPQYGIKEFRIVSVSGDTPKGTFNLVEHEAPARSTLASNLFGQSADDVEQSLSANNDPLLKQQLIDESTVLIPSQPAASSPSGAGAGSKLAQQSAAASSSTSGPAAAAAQVSRPTYLIDLEVSQLLDRENQSSYQLVIEVKDGGQPALIGRLNVTVNVLDANDNDPVFARKSYECQVKEDAAKGTLLLKVQAYDLDLDSNGQITYSIKRHSSPAATTTSQAIPNNSSDNFEASTQGGRFISKQQKQTTTSSVSAKLATATAAQRQQGNEIYEQAASVQQQQEFATGASQEQQQLFRIDPLKGELYLASQLDYETEQVHEFWVEARDHGKPARSAFASVKVIVINDPSDDAPTRLSPASVQSAPVTSYVGGGQPVAQEINISRQGAGEFGAIGAAAISADNIQALIVNWFAKLNSSLLFGMVLFGLASITLPVCFVKFRSHQSESDYNDTDGLTLTSNNGQTKQSPNHSGSNEHSNASNDNHHRHHDHRRRSFVGLSGADASGFATPKESLHYQYKDSSNLYYNPYQHQPRLTNHSGGHPLEQPDSPSQHQMAAGGAGSAGGTMTLHGHHAAAAALLGASPGGHHALKHHHHHHQFASAAGLTHHSSSLTYAHHNSRAAAAAAASLLHPAHHHRSSHHLSSAAAHHHHHQQQQHQHHLNHSHQHHHPSHHNTSKGGTMNSVGTHHSAHPSGSPLTASPKTTLSSGLPPNLHDAAAAAGGHHNPLQALVPAAGRQDQLPPTPCNAPAGIFSSWPPQAPGSTMGGCFASSNGVNGGGGGVGGGGGGTPGSTMDCTQMSVDRWFDLGPSSQLVNAQDWIGSYNWDYLADWSPEYHNLMPLIEPDSKSAY